MRTSFACLLLLFLALPSRPRSQSAPRLDTLEYNGPTSNRLNIVIGGDGWQEQDLPAFRTIARTLIQNTFARGSGSNAADTFYATFRKAYNAFVISTPSVDNGIDQNPPPEELKNTYYQGYLNPLTATSKSGRFNTTTFDNVIRQLMPEADIKVMMLNSGGFRATGGSRITFSNNPSGSVLGHEMGHNVGGLRDEYVDAGLNRTCSPGINATATTVREQITWNHWILPTTPLPTTTAAGNVVGAFEGASYVATGCWRPQNACKMRNNSPPYCAVCLEQMHRQIYNQMSAIDGRIPAAASVTLGQQPGVTFAVVPLLPQYGHYVYSWTLDGNPIDGANGPAYLAVDLAVGTHTLRAVLRDATPAVRKASPMLSDTATWTLQVQPGVRVGPVDRARNDAWRGREAGTLEYFLDRDSRMEIEVKDMRGRIVDRILKERLPAGLGRLKLPQTHGPGLFLYSVRTESLSGGAAFRKSVKILKF